MLRFISVHTHMLRLNSHSTMNFKTLTVFLAVALLTASLAAQSNPFRMGARGAGYRQSYVRLGVGLGMSNYLGDLDDDLTIKFTQPGVSVAAAYRIHQHMCVRGTFYQGWMQADDYNSVNANRRARQLYFKSPLTEFSAQLQVDFVPTDRNFRYRARLIPYAFGGLALFHFNPQTESGIDLVNIGTEGQYIPRNSGNTLLADPQTGIEYPKPYSLYQIAVPLGVGVRFKASKYWDIEFESGFRKTFTDYIDDVSGHYPSFRWLQPGVDNNGIPHAAGEINPQVAQWFGPQAQQLSEPNTDPAAELQALRVNIRGHADQRDWYVYTCVTASFTLEILRCPKFR